jgi:hypothetical protein
VRINIPGRMQDFGAVKPGEVFSYFAKGSQHWGMLSSSEDGEMMRPISLTEPVQKGFGTPCVHELSDFQNRRVFVIDGAEARAIGLEGFLDGSPQPPDGIGALIVTEKSTMVRVKGSSGAWDIAITNGHVQTAKAHPGSLTIPKWEIGFARDGAFKQILQFPRPTVTTPVKVSREAGTNRNKNPSA